MIQPVTCPICDKRLTSEDRESAYFPFCGVRCKQIDLMRWFDGKYVVTEPLDPTKAVMDSLDEDELPE